MTYLPSGLPIPTARPDGLDAPFWDGLRENTLRVQRCRACRNWQWGPEFLCHSCHGFDLGYEDVPPFGVIYSWERVWHPVHPALAGACPYLVVLVSLPEAGHVRMIGNLLGDPNQLVEIGSGVEAVFEHHDAHTLLQWRPTSP